MISILPNWHPMTVHFALALPITATLLLSLARAASDRAFAAGAVQATKWTLGIGIAALWASIGTGMHAYLTEAMDAAAERAVRVHQYWGWGTAAVFTMAPALWQKHHPKRVGWALLTCCWLGTASASVTGWLGAENVYRHGVGVEAVTTAEAEPPASDTR
ncbi:DUF2231 domain-containing protein [Algiphilus sp.]|uniref:DUF2231 domain-containing protein n=1 Tax=Algiphilus sp. TaxID=1872431 RepID=UPI003B52543D